MVEKGIMVVCVCVVVKKVCEVICCKLVLDVVSLLGKLVDCFSKSFEECEIFLVEGDFVGGFIKFGCDFRI